MNNTCVIWSSFSKDCGKANLTLKPSKCKIACPEVLYLGHIITRDGVKVDPQKTAAVDAYRIPKTPKELRGFVGLCNYYRRFVLGFGLIATPLNAMLKKDAKYEWTDKCQQAFTTLKAEFLSAPILAYSNMAQKFIFTTDASSTAIGYILNQKIDREKQPITYVVRPPKRSEKNYSITDLECLAVLGGVYAYRPYLTHRHFNLYTDHSALTSHNWREIVQSLIIFNTLNR